MRAHTPPRPHRPHHTALHFLSVLTPVWLMRSADIIVQPLDQKTQAQNPQISKPINPKPETPNGPKYVTSRNLGE